MRYKDEWRGHLRINSFGRVNWDNKDIGRVVSYYKAGAKSPGGMVTNCVWVAATPYGDTKVEHASQTEAVDWLVRSAHQKKEA
jgi:hypothetical protein